MGRYAGHAFEGAQEMVSAQTCDAREIGQLVGLYDSTLQMPQHAGNSSGVPRQDPTPSRTVGHLNDGPGQLESEFLERVRPYYRHPGPGRERCKRPKRGKAIQAERTARPPRIVRESLEQLRIELKGETAVTFTVLV